MVLFDLCAVSIVQFKIGVVIAFEFNENLHHEVEISLCHPVCDNETAQNYIRFVRVIEEDIATSCPIA